MGKNKRTGKKADIPTYQGWRPRSMRKGNRNKDVRDENRKTKRSRLGNSKQRAIYKSAKGYKHPEYAALCAKADQLNGFKRK